MNSTALADVLGRRAARPLAVRPRPRPDPPRLAPRTQRRTRLPRTPGPRPLSQPAPRRTLLPSIVRIIDLPAQPQAKLPIMRSILACGFAILVISIFASSPPPAPPTGPSFAAPPATATSPRRATRPPPASRSSGAKRKTSAGRPRSRTAAGPRPSSWTARSGSPPPPKTATISTPSASTPTPAKSSTTSTLFHSDKPEPLGNNVNCYAACSPAIEPGRVYVHFGSFGTACLDTSTGKAIWKRDDLPCRHYRGPSSSVVLFENLVILTLDGADLQYVVALDKATGETVWKTDRNVEWNDENITGEYAKYADMAKDGDFRKAHSTPLIVNVERQAAAGERRREGHLRLRSPHRQRTVARPLRRLVRRPACRSTKMASPTSSPA